MERVERIEVSTPFGIGQVNCYAFPGDGGLTLLDPGPKTDDALADLRSGLERAGHAVGDVDRVLITHAHMDHCGLAARIEAASGAAVLAHEAAVDRLADPDGHLEREQAFFRPFLASMGLPEELVDTVVGLPEPFAEFREPVEVDRPLADGDVVDVGFDLRTVHTPGHTPDSVCYVADDAAFTGDHVMLEVSPNPLLTVAPDAPEERTRSLPAYLESLRRIREGGPTVGHAGHRGRVPDVAARASEIVDHHEERKERIAGMVVDAGDAGITAYEVMSRLFSDLPATEMFAGMSEAIGHLDLLEDEGRVDFARAEDVRRYRPA